MYGLLFTYLFACVVGKTDTADTGSATEPSSEASAEPAGEPSGEPSGEPAGEPSGEPAGEPSGEPAGEPSNDPNSSINELAAGDLIISEIHKNPCVLGDDANGDGNPDCTLDDENGEWFEIYNNTSESQNLNGLIVSDNSSEPETFVVNEDIIVPAQGYAVFGTNADTATNGGYTADFAYTGGEGGFKLSNADDEIILSNANGVIDQVYYEDKPVFPDDKGYSLTLNPDTLDATQNDDGANWCNAVASFGDGDFGTPGEANSCE